MWDDNRRRTPGRDRVKADGSAVGPDGHDGGCEGRMTVLVGSTFPRRTPHCSFGPQKCRVVVRAPGRISCVHGMGGPVRVFTALTSVAQPGACFSCAAESDPPLGPTATPRTAWTQNVLATAMSFSDDLRVR